MCAESDPRLRTGELIDPVSQLFITLGAEPGRPAKVVVGLLGDCVQQLAGFSVVRGISIHRILRQLRTNGGIHGVTLPARIAPALVDPNVDFWWREVEEHRKAAQMRRKAKLKGRKAGARGWVNGPHELSRQSLEIEQALTA
jgi:hypothetical protein